MIWESSFWRKELARHAVELVRRKSQRRWPERSMARLEKTLFLGFYSIRKLLEARKLSDSIRDSLLSALSYPPTGRPVALMNWHRLDELYDFSSSTKCTLSLQRLCNLFIHSYVLAPAHDSESSGLSGVLVNSDHTKDEALYQFDVNTIVGLFECVAKDSPYDAHYVLDPSTSDYKVTLASHVDNSAPDA